MFHISVNMYITAIFFSNMEISKGGKTKCDK